MGREKNDEKGNSMISSGLYVLKHKDLDVAMVQIDRKSGKIEYVPDIFLPEELPPVWERTAAGSRPGGHPVLYRIPVGASSRC